MKIVVVSKSLTPAGRWIRELFNFLSKARGDKIYIVTGTYSSRTEMWSDIQENIIQLRIPKIKYVYTILFSILSGRVIKKISPDVVLDNQSFDHFTSSLHDYPIVSVIHDIDELISHKKRPSGIIRCIILKHVLNKAREVIVPSHLTKQKMRSFLSTPLPDNVFVIPWGIDIKRFSPRTNGWVIRKKLELSGSPVMLFVGRTSPNKNIDVLIKALSKVRRKFPSAKLLIVGPNNAPKVVLRTYHNLLNLVHSLKLESSVIFTGEVPESKLSQYFAAADVYVQPSLWGEGFGFSCLEAESSGKPVICTEVFKKTGVVNDKTAIITPGNADDFAKAILEALGNPELRRKLGKAGRKFAQNFSWKGCCERIAKVIAEAAKGS